MSVMSGVKACGLSTVDAHDLLPHKILVSGYRYSKDDIADTDYLDYIQLYNDGNEPIDLSEWSIYIDEVSPNTKFHYVPNQNNGYFLPGNHVVISREGYIDNASYRMSRTMISNPQSFKLIIVAPRSKSGSVTVTEITPAKKYETKTHWTRTRTTTGYGSSFINVDDYMASIGKPHNEFMIYDNGLYQKPSTPTLQIEEIYSYASDCSSLDESVLCGDYIKIRLNADTQQYDKFVLRTGDGHSRTATNTIPLEVVAISADEKYLVVQRTQNNERLSLTNTAGDVWIEELYGIDTQRYSHVRYTEGGGDHQGWSYARMSDNTWRWTVSPQPTSDNVFTEPAPEPVTIKSCPAGQYRNPDTGRCRSLEDAINVLAACDEGYERNPITNRCRKMVSTTIAQLTPCKEGQVRNPETNRCRSVASEVAELIPCDEGYERNPATNRCRKVAGASTNSPLAVPTQASAANSMQVNPYMIAGAIAIVGIGYALYEWRTEIVTGVTRSVSVFRKK